MRLKVPKEERTKQRQKSMIDSNYTGALEELLDVWILNGDHPTWQKLISAVEVYEQATAKSMRKKLGMISEGENIPLCFSSLCPSMCICIIVCVMLL